MIDRNALMEERNYANDSRVRARDRWFSSFDESKMIAYVDYYDDSVLEIPCVYEVCPTCNGKGSHVNPSIDCNGLSAEDFAEDPDFAESYFAGHYDEPCYGCGGNRVVPVPVEDCNSEDLRLLHEMREDEAAFRAEYWAERRMGA